MKVKLESRNLGDDVECEEIDSEMADSQGGAEGEIDTDTDMIIVV